MNKTNESVLRDAYLALMNLEYVNPNAEDNCGLYGHGFLAAKMKALAIIHPALAATATVAKDGGEVEPVYWLEAEESARNCDPRDVFGKHSMLYSTRMSMTKPTGNNPCWPLYLHPAPTATPHPEASAEQPVGERSPIGYVSKGVIDHALSKGFGASAYIQAGQATEEFPVAIYLAASISEDTGRADSSSAAPSDERGKFEAWAMPCYILDREEDNTYSGRGAYIAWSAWQFRAALAAPSPTRESLSARKAVLEEVANYLADVHSITLANEIRALKTVPGEPT